METTLPDQTYQRDSHQTYQREMERCAICLVLSRHCIGNEGLWEVGTDLLDEHSQKDATNQPFALSAFLNNISEICNCFATAR